MKQRSNVSFGLLISILTLTFALPTTAHAFKLVGKVITKPPVIVKLPKLPAPKITTPIKPPVATPTCTLDAATQKSLNALPAVLRATAALGFCAVIKGLVPISTQKLTKAQCRTQYDAANAQLEKSYKANLKTLGASLSASLRSTSARANLANYELCVKKAVK